MSYLLMDIYGLLYNIKLIERLILLFNRKDKKACQDT